MPSPFSIILLKLLVFSAFVTIVASIAGQQIGDLTYAMLSPRTDDPAIQRADRRKPVVKKQTALGTAAKKTVASNVVKEAVPNHQGGAGSTTAKSESPAFRTKVIEMAANTTESKKTVYAIQTGVFSSKTNAEENVERIKIYSPATVILTCGNGQKIYAVRIGSFAEKSDAEKALANFKKKENMGAILVFLYEKHDLMGFCKK